jgi:alginate O-acetyltransferase complex protein AlgI
VLFNSFVFLFVFLPLVIVAYFAFPQHRARLVLIVLASYVFYAYAKWWFALLMAASTLIGFVGGQAVERAAEGTRRKLALGLTVALLLALLGAFKYAAFVGGNLTSFVGVITAHGFPGLHAFLNGIVLPIGISFYTFEGISYAADVYRGKLPAERDPLRYAFFISFFPHLIAGPIVRYGILRPQLLHKHSFDVDRVRSGLLLFALGLAKKTLVADSFASWVNRYLDHPASLHAFEAWAAIVGFGFQIYFDFSAYSDMALGLARIFGIELPWNFNRPYRASSPIEFWRRWHVTLSSWLRDYLYIPLGGNRKGERRRDANLIATMGLGGLWHGASLNFVVWGLYQGLLLLSTHHLRKRALRIPSALAVAVTFVVVMLGWVFFRLHSAAAIGDAVGAMFLFHGLGQVPGHLLLLIAVACAYTAVVPEEWTWDVRSFGFARVATVGGLLAVAIASIYTSHPFIYFRF